MASKTPFSPQGGAGQKIAATDTEAAVAIGHASGQKQLLLSSTGTNVVFVKFGDSTVTAAEDDDMPILPNTQVIVSITQGVTHISTVCASGESATLWVTPGNGS
jgi:hypothetical protein